MNRDDANVWVYVLVGSVALLLLMPLMGMGAMMGWGGWMHNWGWGGAVGAVLMLLFWGALILGGVGLVRSLSRRQDDAALRTLRERYARGEIDREEYEERRRVLTEDADR